MPNNRINAGRVCVDAAKAMRDVEMTFVLHLTGYRRWLIRVWAAKKLIWLAGVLIGCKVTVAQEAEAIPLDGSHGDVD